MKTIIPISNCALRFRRSTSVIAISLTTMFSAWIACSGSSMAAVEAGTWLETYAANPANHKVTITRDAKDDKQSAMIAAAEAAQASKEALLQASGENGIPEGNNVWWYKNELGVRIPCAITAEAITYYSELIAKFSKQNMERHAEPSSRLNYHASVTIQPNFELQDKTYNNVYVVTLKLTFSQNFAATETESMQFQKQRVVVLDADGKILKIDGDGSTEVSIMAM